MGLWTTDEYETLAKQRRMNDLRDAARPALREGQDANTVLRRLRGLPDGGD